MRYSDLLSTITVYKIFLFPSSPVIFAGGIDISTKSFETAFFIPSENSSSLEGITTKQIAKIPIRTAIIRERCPFAFFEFFMWSAPFEESLILLWWYFTFSWYEHWRLSWGKSHIPSAYSLLSRRLNPLWSFGNYHIQGTCNQSCTKLPYTFRVPYSGWSIRQRPKS